MQPTLFGRGTWYFIFKILYYFYRQEKKNIELVLLIKNTSGFDENLNRLRYVYFNNNIFFTYESIQKGNTDNLIALIKYNNIEQLKKKLNHIIQGLPCEECKQHSLALMKANNIFNSQCFFYIFHFFIELRNKFYSNIIDRSLFNTDFDIIKNEKILFSKIINTRL